MVRRRFGVLGLALVAGANTGSTMDGRADAAGGKCRVGFDQTAAVECGRTSGDAGTCVAATI